MHKMAVWPSSLYSGAPKSSSEAMSRVKCTIPLSCFLDLNFQWGFCCFRLEQGSQGMYQPVTNRGVVFGHSCVYYCSNRIDTQHDLITLHQMFYCTLDKIWHSRAGRQISNSHLLYFTLSQNKFAKTDIPCVCHYSKKAWQYGFNGSIWLITMGQSGGRDLYDGMGFLGFFCGVKVC